MAVPRLFHGQYALAGIFAVVGGAISGALFAWMNSLAERRLARQGITPTNTDPIQVRELEIKCPADAAFDLSIRALQGIPKLRVVRQDSTSHEIDAKVGVTFWSFGESVTVRLEALGRNSTRVIIRSQPRLSTTTVDWGKAAQNVELFVRSLGELAGDAGT
jgi:hypothetical protein